MFPTACMTLTVDKAEQEGGPRTGGVKALEDCIAMHDRPLRSVVLPAYFVWAVVAEEERLAANPELAAMFDRLASALPVGRVGTAEDVAEAILFPMQSGFTTGTVLHVEGGQDLAAP
mgnify:CR=1 FL=1